MTDTRDKGVTVIAMAEEDQNYRLADIKAVNEARARVQMRKVQGRERLQQSARESTPATQEERELARLKVYLGDWAERQVRGGQPKLSAGGSCLADYMKPSSPTMTQLLGASNAWALGVVDASVDDLLSLPDGSRMRAALRVRWLNERVSGDVETEIRVFRSGRLQAMDLREVDDLADRGEHALMPICRRRGLPL